MGGERGGADAGAGAQIVELYY
eukprot:SAG31_NODE_1154_length_9635_cov_3.552118_7_plen_21_part_01